jgi:hypothetical protein
MVGLTGPPSVGNRAGYLPMSACSRSLRLVPRQNQLFGWPNNWWWAGFGQQAIRTVIAFGIGWGEFQRSEKWWFC